MRVLGHRFSLAFWSRDAQDSVLFLMNEKLLTVYVTSQVENGISLEIYFKILYNFRLV
jgi:hypothetical protein